MAQQTGIRRVTAAFWHVIYRRRAPAVMIFRALRSAASRLARWRWYSLGKQIKRCRTSCAGVVVLVYIMAAEYAVLYLSPSRRQRAARTPCAHEAASPTAFAGWWE